MHQTTLGLCYFHFLHQLQTERLRDKIPKEKVTLFEFITTVIMSFELLLTKRNGFCLKTLHCCNALETEDAIALVNFESS